MSKKNGLEVSEAGKSQASETTPLVSKTSGNGDDAEINKNDGLSINQTSLLVVGEIAGAGVLALPRALVKTGWLGVPILILLALMAAFSGKRLGDCWSMIESRDPQMRTRQRNPYAIIADKSLGRAWSAAVSVALVTTQFGVAVVYLLLAAQIVQQLFLALVPTITICIWYLIVVGAMTPLILYGTPKDFSLLGSVAVLSTVVACVLYFIQMMNDVHPFVFRWGMHGFKDFFLAIGMMMFAFNGVSTFPTIQNDMADKSKFNKSLQYSFAAIMALYLPIAVGGYAVYGESVAPNFAASLAATPLTLVAHLLMAVTLVSAFVISINPVCQEVEELNNIPRDSLGHRSLVRLCIMGVILFIGESIPRFYTILALTGGTSIAFLTFILPCYCFLKLDSQSSGEEQQRSSTSDTTKMLCWQILVIAAIGAVLATYSSASAIFSTAQVTPCYLR